MARKRRAWISLYKYQELYGPLDFELPDLRTEPRTCKWCLGPLQNNRRKSFCCSDCKYAWEGQYVWNRNRPAVPWRVLCRDKFACRKCGWASRYVNEHGVSHFSTEGLDVHHIHHVADGGTDHESNLITLCRDCHMEEHGKRSKEGEKAWLKLKPTEQK